MKLLIKTKEIVEKEVDVTFPLYLEDGDTFETSSYLTRYQIHENGLIISITKYTYYTNKNVKFQIEKRTLNLQNDLGSMLTMDKSSPAEYQTLLAEMMVEMVEVSCMANQ